MKSIKVSELKAHLSKYLRMASRGTSIVVKDRDEPIAQIGPPQGEAAAWHERLAREGGLRLGSQDFRRLVLTKLDRSIDIQSALQEVREDPGEVRRR